MGNLSGISWRTRSLRVLVGGLLALGLSASACETRTTPGDTTGEPPPPPPTSTPTLSLVAGTLGNGNVDGQGSRARFYYSNRVTADGAGNLYIAEPYNQTIRKLVIATGVVTTLAGDPSVVGADDGTGGAAHFNGPVGITSDGAGNLYIADAHNHAIRKVDVATGAVTTIAGKLGVAGSADGTGAAALFSLPTAVALDGGDLYVADSGNSTIRKVVLATGAVSTLVGTPGVHGSNDGVGPSAQLDAAYPVPNYPDKFSTPTFDLVSDGAGSLYLAEAKKIRKIAVATAAVTTLAVSPGTIMQPESFLEDLSFVALTHDHAGKLYVAKTRSTIDEVDLASSQSTPVPGFQGEPFAGSRAGITSSPDGHLYVTNEGAVLAVASDGAQTVLAGFRPPEMGSADGTGAAAQLNRPMGAAEDGAGHLDVADSENSTLREIVLATGAVTTFAGSPGLPGTDDGAGAAARFDRPTGMVGDGLGNLYVVDSDRAAIRKLALATGTTTTLVAPLWKEGEGATYSIYSPADVTIDGAGSLYVADVASIRRVDTATGAVTTLAGPVEVPGELPSGVGSDGVGPSARFAFPRGLTSAGDGNLYVADATTVRKVVIATGEVTTLAGSLEEPGSIDGAALTARFKNASSIASDHAGNLYVGDEDNHAVRKIVIATGAVTTVVGSLTDPRMILGPLPGGLIQPTHVSVISQDRLIITTPGAVLMAQF